MSSSSTGPDIATLDDFRAFVGSAQWTTARSVQYQNLPHQYVVTERYPDRPRFEAAVLFIRRHGKEEGFYRRSFIYLECDGLKYWTMGDPLPQTRVINRADARNQYPDLRRKS